MIFAATAPLLPPIHRKDKIMQFKTIALGTAAFTCLVAPMAAQAGMLGNMINHAMSGKHEKGPPGGSAKVSKPEAFKGVRQVVIGQFTVAYFQKNVNYGADSLLSSASGAKTNGELSGVDASDFQTATDAVYEAFKAQLTAQGITVVDPAEYMTNKYRAGMKPEDQGIGIKVQLDQADHADAAMYWPAQIGRHDIVMSQAVRGMMNMQRLGNINAANQLERDFAKASGIPVLNVQLLVDFAEPLKASQQTTDSTYLSTTSTTMRQGARIAISHYGSQMTLITPGESLMSEGGKVVLQSPIVESGDFVEASGKSSNAVAQAIGGLAGLHIQSQAKFRFHVTDPAAYRAAVQSAGNKAATLFVSQMAALR